MPSTQHSIGKCLLKVCFMRGACKYWAKPKQSHKGSYICKGKRKNNSPVLRTQQNFSAGSMSSTNPDKAGEYVCLGRPRKTDNLYPLERESSGI